MSAHGEDDWRPTLATLPRVAALARIDRRTFLKISATATGGLLIACQRAPQPADGAGTAKLPKPSATPRTPTGVALGVFVRIDPDGNTVIGARGSEIGQGVKTSLPMIIAEELDADWSKVRVEQLPLGLVRSDDERGYDWKYGSQFAGGSTNVSDAWQDLRQVGAKARWLLLQAGAKHWRTDASTLTTRPGLVVHADGRTLGYGQLAAIAATFTAPDADVALKSPAEYRIIGKPTRVVDAADIVTGRALYGIDASLPGALIAVVARCPYFDGTLASFDASETKRIPGVRDVVVLPGPRHGEPLTRNLTTGVAVIADDTWSAIKGRRALKVQWTRGPYANESSASLDAQCTRLLQGTGQRVRNDGDVDVARRQAARVIEAVYRVPYVSHSPLEPQNACAHVQADRVDIIAPMQDPSGAQDIANEITGIDRFSIEVGMTRIGGGFGRRLTNDFVAEAVLLSKLTGKPIKVVWTRDDDLQHDFYRPFGHHHMVASLDGAGAISGWTHRLASASKYYRRDGVKPEDMWKAELYPDDFPTAAIPNLRKEWFAVDSGMTRGSWRAPAHTANAFVVQSFIDEIAHATGRDPLALQLQMLGAPRELKYESHGGPVFDTGRLAGVLKLAAERIGWGRKLPKGRGLGLAAHFTFGGYAAHAIEVSVDARGIYRIERCICACDVGRQVNPLGVQAQMMGGTIDGLSTARSLEITIEGGRVLQNDFNSYPLMKMKDAPDVEVIAVQSERDPVGAGEMGIPSAAPALTNALFAATGVRIRSLPIRDQIREGMEIASS